jgi:transcriptional regulator with XRE-family HTH domain
LAVFRAAAGLSRVELAERAGIHRETVARFERHEHRPTPATARAVAAALGCEPADLFPNDARPADNRARATTNGQAGPHVSG